MNYLQAKAVYSLEPRFATELYNCLDRAVAHAEQKKACELLESALRVYGQKDGIDNVTPRETRLTHCLGSLFVTFINAMNCMAEEATGGILEHAFFAADMCCKVFFNDLNRMLRAYSKSFEKGTHRKRKCNGYDHPDELAGEIDIIMTTGGQENEEVSALRSAKKRKKKVLQSQEAETHQFDDRKRAAEQELKRTAMLQKLRDMEDNFDGGLNDASRHPVAFEIDAPTIYLDPHIGRKVKPHQENGIQFMWRQIVAGKGCMLAHTMGLGKTMQVISLLITIAQASNSDDPGIQAQVPASLRKSRTLILAPPTLVDNWYDEILMWTPPKSLVLGDVRRIAAATNTAERMSHIRRWGRAGGVLLMSYTLFKNIVEKEAATIPEEYKQKYADLLTGKPNIVVADEAHHMKNPKSKLAKAAKKVITKVRIALTGSPLSNHLEEYHQMVDWVAPEYLGSLVQFKAKYSEPIREGLYYDSTPYERKLSARKLLVLKRDLEPKICRADISAIAKDMPNKAEFFITIPLTAVQKEVYSKYVKHMLHDHGGGSLKQTNIWSWLGVLSLLLNHPSAFVHKLKDGNKTGAGTSARGRDVSVETDEGALPADVSVSDSGLSSEAIQDILNGFHTLASEELEDVQHSYRSLLTAQIIKESMRIGEKVLIFSHSIPTLDYLERTLEKLNCTYARIDGSTSMSTRQDTVKDFNKKKDVQVMLISTTAGGLGLNLQAANRVIIYDFNFNPTWEEQAIGRAYRLGQRKHVFVYRFRAGGTFEETAYNMSIFKTQLFARVVDKRNPTRFASKKLSDYLFPPRDVDQSDLTECTGKDAEVLDRIMKAETCIRKVELTETFQVEEDDELTPEELNQAEQEYQEEVLARTNATGLAGQKNKRERKPKQWQPWLRQPSFALQTSTHQPSAPGQSTQMA
jgi:SNF2 family DNA or RNA helicase